MYDIQYIAHNLEDLNIVVEYKEDAQQVRLPSGRPAELVGKVFGHAAKGFAFCLEGL